LQAFNRGKYALSLLLSLLETSIGQGQQQWKMPQETGFLYLDI